ncbi:hypothetical protein ACFSTA_20645 [Ornithinibacillus salinisoli]|uniref:ParB/Sulfiredoxin domain-containing protein n=1 Tax=Ornithinibacillus salinisoli TaxID=1848459 RepID=A0ABW4W615_9BACI
MSIPEGIAGINSDSTIVSVEVSKCRDWQGYSYTEKGWHYLSATIKEYIKNPTITPNESILNKYYKIYQPTSIQDCLFYHEKKDDRLPPITNNILQLPWGFAFDMGRKNNQHFGPNSTSFIKKEFTDLIHIYNKLAKEGYQPDKHPDGYIKGHFLKKYNDYRFILSGGQHRMAALGVLGNKKIPVKLYHKWQRVIDIENINAWPHVQNGKYDLETSIKVFNSYFTNTGREKAKKLNLLA